MSKPRFYCTPDALCSAHEAGAPAGPCGIHPIPVDAAEIARLVALLATPWPRSVAGKTRRRLAAEELAELVAGIRIGSSPRSTTRPSDTGRPKSFSSCLA